MTRRDTRQVARSRHDAFHDDDHSRARITAGPLSKSDIATLNRTLEILAFFDPGNPNFTQSVREVMDTCTQNLQMGPGWRIAFNRDMSTGAVTAVVRLAEDPEDKFTAQRRAIREKEEDDEARWKNRVLTERRLLGNRKEDRLRAQGCGTDWDYGRGCPRRFDGKEYEAYCRYVLDEARMLESQPRLGIAELVEQRKEKEKGG